MPSGQEQVAPSPSFGMVLYRIVVAALLLSALVLVACILVGKLSGAGVESYLQASGLCFSLVGALALGHGLGAETRSAHDKATTCYVMALMNYSIAYNVFLVHGLARALVNP
ncbi:hypothetical protein [Microvirga massiliensis]|uniref:hypothetical protein n=1 Tax=Microvirga massiliensis TaxID=1033741 RepID=UPI00062BA649|nr:hypothetical protein [Microvirga massiliensis]